MACDPYRETQGIQRKKTWKKAPRTERTEKQLKRGARKIANKTKRAQNRSERRRKKSR
jgi:predicted RNA-binding protein